MAFTEVFLSYRAYLIAAPSVFRSGVEEVISVTIFNSPREVMVQAQLVAQGEAVAWSQGAILGRSLGCLTRASSPSAKWSLGLRPPASFYPAVLGQQITTGQASWTQVVRAEGRLRACSPAGQTPDPSRRVGFGHRRHRERKSGL